MAGEREEGRDCGKEGGLHPLKKVKKSKKTQERIQKKTLRPHLSTAREELDKPAISLDHSCYSPSKVLFPLFHTQRLLPSPHRGTHQ